MSANSGRTAEPARRHSNAQFTAGKAGLLCSLGLDSQLDARLAFVGSVFVLMNAVACAGLAVPVATAPRASAPAAGSSAPAATAGPNPSGSSPIPSGLFIPAQYSTTPTPSPSVSRSRFVKINVPLLLSSNGQALPLPANAEIVLNLFPDVVYTGVVEQIQQEGDGYSWVGHLKGLDTSTMTIVYTAGVFAGNFASPAGVYEVSHLSGDLYQVIAVNQSPFQGGD